MSGIYCESYSEFYCGEYPCGGGLYKCSLQQLKRIKTLKESLERAKYSTILLGETLRKANVQIKELKTELREKDDALKNYYGASMRLAEERNDFENKFIKLQNSYYALELADGCFIRQQACRFENIKEWVERNRSHLAYFHKEQLEKLDKILEC